MGPPSQGRTSHRKYLWVRDIEPAVFEKTYKFLSVKGYLLYHATGKFVMSYDDGNLTWMMDTRKNRMCWSDELLADMKFPKEKLPDLIKCTDIVGPLTPVAAEVLGLREETPVIGGGGDVIAATVGAGTVREKEGHIYIGTSDWVTCRCQQTGRKSHYRNWGHLQRPPIQVHRDCGARSRGRKFGVGAKSIVSR